GLLASSTAAAGAGDTAGLTTDHPKFSEPTRIDNRWFPLVPGTQLVSEGRAKEGTKLLPHQIVFIVTDLTKVIRRVRTRVVWERDCDAGKLAESELAFYAQDDDGNVWIFGEYPEEWQRGKLTGAPDTWIAGVQRARAGIVMPAAPRVGSPSYREGF